MINSESLQPTKGDLLPDLGDAITSVITTPVSFGITAGYLTLTKGRYSIPASSRGGRDDRAARVGSRRGDGRHSE